MCHIDALQDRALEAELFAGSFADNERCSDWVSELSPPSVQKQLSYLVGWLWVLGWQVGNVALAYLCGTIIQGLAALIHAEYQPTSWQAVLIFGTVLTLSLVYNTVFARWLPLLESVIFIVHVCGFIVIIGVFWALADTENVHDVLYTFRNGGGWGSQGLSCLVGILSPISSFLGPDSATHMAEELRDAARTLPLAIIWTSVNGAVEFVIIVTCCMAIGDLDDALDSPSGYPSIEISCRHAL